MIDCKIFKDEKGNTIQLFKGMRKYYKVKNIKPTREVCPELVGLVLPFFEIRDGWIWCYYYDKENNCVEERFFGEKDVEIYDVKRYC